MDLKEFWFYIFTTKKHRENKIWRWYCFIL